MFPHERTLVNRMTSKKFALLGINTDSRTNAQEMDAFRRQMRENQINWRSWGDGKGGAICRQYRVQAFPTMMLIDAKGVIRKKWVGAPSPAELDQAIEEAMKV